MGSYDSSRIAVGMRYTEPDISLHCRENVVMVFAPSPSKFVVQLTRTLDGLAALMAEISTYYNSGHGRSLALSSLRPGLPCVAQYSIDGLWYRALVENVSLTSVQVYFVDYGNSEHADPASLMEMVPQFMRFPAQGVVCNLMGAQPDQGTSWSTRVSESFLELTDGKDLQSVFVLKNGGIFDVILDDLSDPDRVSINERFGVTFEVVRKFLPVKPVTVPQALQNVPPQCQVPQIEELSSVYQLPNFPPLTRSDVVVSWFVTPDEFYCHNLNFDNDFRDLVNKIQQSSQELSPVSGAIDVGDAVIAKFPCDGVLYRGEIKAVKGGMSYLVEYVDYGNTEVVTKSNLWDMEAQFLSLPRHAIPCFLKGVKPANSKWSSCKKDYADLFGADSIECTFCELKNGRYSVGLSVGNKCVASELVQRGLAIAETESSGSREETQYDLELLPGQQLVVHIAFIESVSKFYVHLDPSVAQGIQDAVSEYVQQTQIKNRFSLDNLEKFSLCLASPDGTSWYRAKILDVTSPRDVLVSFIDYGDTSEVPLDQMLSIPEALADFFPQATECFISGSNKTDISAAIEDQFKEMEAQDAIIYVDSHSSGRLGVQVFDLDGMRLEMLKSVIESPLLMVEPLCPMPVKNYTECVWVSHVDGPQSLWLQATASEPHLLKLLDDLHKFYEVDAVGQVMDTPEIGLLCAAKSAKDDGWYRARVKSVDQNGVFVLFLDYGNCEIVTFESVRELDPSFFTPHALSLCTSLGVVAQDENKCQEYLTQSVSETVFNAVFVRDSSGAAWMIDLMREDNCSLCVQLLDCGLVMKDKAIPEIYSYIHLPEGEKCLVNFAHFESPSEFYVQLASSSQAICDFQATLNERADSLTNINKQPTAGMLCAAQFSLDSEWYRALILDHSSSTVKVRFVDYGNVEEIDITSHSLKILPKELRIQPFYAVKCSLSAKSLANIKEVKLLKDLAQDPEQANEIEVLKVDQSTIVQLILPAEEFPKVTSNQQDCLQIQEVYSEPQVQARENFATMSYTGDFSTDVHVEPQVRARENIATVGCTGDCRTDDVTKDRVEGQSFIWHVTTPAEFWIQDDSVTPLLDEMTERLAEATSFPTLECVEEGLLCAALFPEDGLWYRARILKIIEGGACVRYIDYGNSSLSIQLRALPPYLVNLPPLAKCCQLILPDTLTPRSLDGGETVELRIGVNGDPMIVQMKSTEEILPSTADAIPESEQGHEVTLCHVTSPQSFWVHFTKDLPLLDEIADKLSLCETYDHLPEPSPGALCAALFPEDEQWYRAEVLSCSDNGIEVFFIDYGNSSLSTNLRCLPPEILDIPRVAKHCCLPFPEGRTSWSLAAEEQFLNISADDSKSFLMKIIHEGDPACVSLSCNGIRIEEEILKNCPPEENHSMSKCQSPVEIDLPFTQPTEGKCYSEVKCKFKIVGISVQEEEKVVISHINSLTSFWIQRDRLQSELDEMAEKLEIAETFDAHLPRLFGLICAAQYNEDLSWYRARILRCTEEGTEVIFIDYGNTSLCSQLRRLPTDLAAIPPLAKHCNLVLPENWTEWPQESEEEFLKMFGDGSNVYEITVIIEGDPSLVSLVHEGIRVEDKLKKKYEEEIGNTNNVTKTVLESEEIVEEVIGDPGIVNKEEVFAQEPQKMSEISVKPEDVPQEAILEGRFRDELDNPGEDNLKNVVNEDITVLETNKEVLVIEEYNVADEGIIEEIVQENVDFVDETTAEVENLDAGVTSRTEYYIEETAVEEHCIEEIVAEEINIVETEDPIVEEVESKVYEADNYGEVEPTACVHESSEIDKEPLKDSEDYDGENIVMEGNVADEGTLQDTGTEEQTLEETEDEVAEQLCSTEDHVDEEIVENCLEETMGVEITVVDEKITIMETEHAKSTGTEKEIVVIEFNSVQEDVEMKENLEGTSEDVEEITVVESENEHSAEIDKVIAELKSTDEDEFDIMRENLDEAPEEIDEEITVVETENDFPAEIDKEILVIKELKTTNGGESNMTENLDEATEEIEEITVVETENELATEIDSEIIVIEELETANDGETDKAIENLDGATEGDEEITAIEIGIENEILEENLKELGVVDEVLTLVEIEEPSTGIKKEILTVEELNSVSVDVIEEEFTEGISLTKECVTEDSSVTCIQISEGTEHNEIIELEKTVNSEISVEVDSASDCQTERKISNSTIKVIQNEVIIGDSMFECQTYVDNMVNIDHGNNCHISGEIGIVNTDEGTIVQDNFSLNVQYNDEMVTEEKEFLMNGNQCKQSGNKSKNEADSFITIKDLEISIESKSKDVLFENGEEVCSLKETKSDESSVAEVITTSYERIDDVTLIGKGSLERQWESVAEECVNTLYSDIKKYSEVNEAKKSNEVPSVGKIFKKFEGNKSNLTTADVNSNKFIKISEHTSEKLEELQEEKHSDLEVKKLVFGDETKLTVSETKSFESPTKLRTSQLPLQSRRLVRITHAVSPEDFWVRYKNTTLLLDDITQKLVNAQAFDPLLIAVEGTFCVTRCSEKETFQRGKVVRCNELTTEVFFLDSGKTAICTKLFGLPEGLETIPPLAKHCCLNLPEGWKSWPHAADLEFMNILEDDSKDFELIVLEDGDPVKVSMLCNGMKVEGELEKLLTSR